MTRGVTLIEVLVVALIMGLCLPTLLTLISGQEREIRWSAHQIDVACVACGRLGELEGRLAARRFPKTPLSETRAFELASGDHRISVTERARVRTMDGQPGLFLIEVEYDWVEPYAGSQADRKYALSLVVVDPEHGLRDLPVVQRDTGGG